MSRRPPGAAGRATALAAGLLACAVQAAAGQDGPARGRDCTLVLQATTDSTESVSIEVAPDTYVTHVRNGLRWTCGSARMVADSAVRHEQAGRLEMIGSVDYRDSVRTLLADTVTYFEREDRIVARGEVHLTRRATGSTLEGPRVVFLRATSREARRTVATGRPRMRIRRDTAASDTAPPVRVDGDRIVLMGDEEARVSGDVRIHRTDVDAAADSAVFRLGEETGELHGSPEVMGGTWRLTGDTIRTRFEEGELREVTAVEDGHAQGEDFELFAPRIRARMLRREIDRLWAFGPSRPVAYSAPYRLSADSLAFRFRAGDLDELHAVGRADAVEVGDSVPDEPRADVALGAGDRSWVAADTLKIGFTAGAADSAAARADSLPTGALAADSTAAADGAGRRDDPDPAGEGEGGAGPGRSGDRRIEVIRALGDARAYHLLESEEPDGRPGRHYQRGAEIVVHFEGGEAQRLEGTSAVGIHLDPTDDAPAAGGDAGSPAPPDTASRGRSGGGRQ